MSVVLILSSFGAPPKAFQAAIARRAVTAVKQSEMQDRDLEGVAGVITTMHLDQVDFAARAEFITRFLDRGGRLAFMGHLMRPFLPELSTFVPLGAARRADFALTELSPHPVFEGIARCSLETRHGVAGFYGRGHVPPPAGAVALTGLGPERVVVDWVWARPQGGALFVHAGNDLWTIADDPAVNDLFAERLTGWCAGDLPASTDTSVASIA
jgi:hypothetical protein